MPVSIGPFFLQRLDHWMTTDGRVGMVKQTSGNWRCYATTADETTLRQAGMPVWEDGSYSQLRPTIQAISAMTGCVTTVRLSQPTKYAINNITEHLPECVMCRSTDGNGWTVRSIDHIYSNRYAALQGLLHYFLDNEHHFTSPMIIEHYPQVPHIVATIKQLEIDHPMVNSYQ